MSNRGEGDWGETELDAAERADAQINLDDPSAGDNEPWSPPDRQPRPAEYVDGEAETLDVRIRQEEPDPAAAVEPERMVGGDDPDAIAADEDVLGVEDDGVGDDGVGDPIDLDDEPGPEAGAMHLE